MACRGTFLSHQEKNDPDPKLGQYVDLDKAVCAMYCWDM